GPNDQRRQMALELLLRRELLANAAGERNLHASDEEVVDEIKKGWFFLGGQRESLKSIVFDEDGAWSLQRHKAWVAQLNVSQKAYQDEQRRELEAVMMATAIADAVAVSPAEAQDLYLRQHDTVMLDAVVFKAG